MGTGEEVAVALGRIQLALDFSFGEWPPIGAGVDDEGRGVARAPAR
jgi:hypothetical protein